MEHRSPSRWPYVQNLERCEREIAPCFKQTCSPWMASGPGVLLQMSSWHRVMDVSESTLQTGQIKFGRRP